MGTLWASDHILVFDTDQADFGGHDRLKTAYNARYVPTKGQWHNRPHSIKVYVPCRTAIVLVAQENLTEEIRDKALITVPPKPKASQVPETAAAQPGPALASATKEERK